MDLLHEEMSCQEAIPGLNQGVNFLHLIYRNDMLERGCLIIDVYSRYSWEGMEDNACVASYLADPSSSIPLPIIGKVHRASVCVLELP